MVVMVVIDVNADGREAVTDRAHKSSLRFIRFGNAIRHIYVFFFTKKHRPSNNIVASVYVLQIANLGFK